MKRAKLLSLLLTIPVLFGCDGDKPCEHIDANFDGVCDLCKEVIGEPHTDHRDLDHNGICDICNQAMPEKNPLEIPSVDVDTFSITLPAKPTRTYNQADIKTDDTYDYLSFYEVSDFHGAVNFEAGETIGLSKLATYFETLRNGNPGGTIFLSSGDMFQGSAESNLTRGYSVNYCMNYMGFETMTIGNHEFDWTDEWLTKNSNLSYNGEKIPYLGANIIDKRTNEIPSFAKPSHIIYRGDYKIGIVGTIGEKLESSILKTCVENYEFTSEADAVKAEATRLKEEEKCDVVIWSSHNGVDEMESLNIQKSDGVDAAFGGHSHINKYDYSNVSGIPYAATKNYGKGIAKIELKINKTTKEVSNFYTNVIDTTDLGSIEDNSDINSIISQYDVEINKIKDIKLGRTDKKLAATGTLKSICVDAMQKSTFKFLSDNNVTEIDSNKVVLATHNTTGGIRADINVGDITYGDVYKPFPFDNEIVLYEISGRDLYYNITKKPYTYFALWHSFTSLSELVTTETYYVITTDFLALSEKYLNLKEDVLYHTGLIVRDEIAKYIYDLGDINSQDYRGSQFQSF